MKYLKPFIFESKSSKKEFKNKVFDLYKKAKNGDKNAKRELINLYNNEFPNNKIISSPIDKKGEMLHTVYLHLSK